MKELGEYLKEQRESSGVGLDEASSDLDINAFYLESLEGGNTRAFSDMMEAKDILLKYCKYLGVEEEAALKEFDDFLFERTSKIDLDMILKAEEDLSKKEAKVYSPYTRPVKLIRYNNINTAVVIRVLVILLLLLILLIYKLAKPIGTKSPVVELMVRSFYEIKFTQ